jgi:hypothetical protein
MCNSRNPGGRTPTPQPEPMQHHRLELINKQPTNTTPHLSRQQLKVRAGAWAEHDVSLGSTHIHSIMTVTCRQSNKRHGHESAMGERTEEARNASPPGSGGHLGKHVFEEGIRLQLLTLCFCAKLLLPTYRLAFFEPPCCRQL